MTAVLALRPDGADGAPPPLLPGTDDGPVPALPVARLVAYLDDVDRRATRRPARRSDPAPPPTICAAFVHTGRDHRRPRRSPRTPTPTSSPAAGTSPWRSGWRAGDGRCSAGCRCSTSTPCSSPASPPCSSARGSCGPGPLGYRSQDLYARFWQIVEHYRITAMSARPHRLRRAGPGPGRRRHQLAAHCPSSARPRCRRPCARTSRAHTGRAAAGGLRPDRGDLRQHLHPASGERTRRIGRQASCPSQRVKAVADRRTTAPGPTAARARSGVLVIGGPTVFAGYVTDPALGGPRVSRDGHRSGTAGSTPATWAASTPTATSTSPGGPRTSSSAAATTSTPR